MNIRRQITFQILLAILVCYWASAQKVVTVAKDGSASYHSIQDAIDSFADDVAEKIVKIKSGVYAEQIFISKNNLSLIGDRVPIFGESWESLNETGQLEKTGVVIQFPIYRAIFRCEHPDDWGAAVVNIRANDVSMKNLTIANTFGFDLKQADTIDCQGKPVEISRDGHQFALRAMPPTQRLQVKHCNFYSLGGDTVSPWDVENGTYIFSDCTMEGAVDLYCPRGWAFASRIYFICHNMNAAIWHDGSADSTAVSVIQNSKFVGEPEYKLGRFHRDAQVYLKNCHFSKEMADAEIYQVATRNLIQWGKRIFYKNCTRSGEAFPWFADNITRKEAKRFSRKRVLQPRWNTPVPYQNKVNHNILPTVNGPR
jgi:pectinesterase